MDQFYPTNAVNRYDPYNFPADQAAAELEYRRFLNEKELQERIHAHLDNIPTTGDGSLFPLALAFGFFLFVLACLGLLDDFIVDFIKIFFA